MGWDIIIELVLEHDYYSPNLPPVTVQPTDSDVFGRDGLILRQSGERIFVLAEDGNPDLPAKVDLNLVAQNTDVIAVTDSANWSHIPHICIGMDKDRVGLGPDNQTDTAQWPGNMLLAQVSIDFVPGSRRALTIHFSAMTSHWAYHVIGPGNNDVFIEDPEGDVDFVPIGTVDLPDGVKANVIRTRSALPARARPNQRFSLSRPGPFGPRTLIPVLPAPQPMFAQVPAPDGKGAIIQSDIYVSIF